MAAQQKTSDDPNMKDLMNAVVDIQARIIRMESTQTRQSERMDEIESRVSSVEKVERTFPWKVLGIVGGAVALLLIPTISTLITVGRRDESLQQTVETVREVRDDVRQIGAHVEELHRDGVSREERIRSQQRRLEVLEGRARDAEMPRQTDPRRR